MTDTDLSEAQCLALAAAAHDYPAQAHWTAAAEAARTARMAAHDAARALDLTHIPAAVVPGHVHEHHTAATDWLTEVADAGWHTSSQAEAEHALIATAVAWFDRVPDVVKADPDEYAVQAHGLARRQASTHGQWAEHAQAAFLSEADRLRARWARTAAAAAVELLPELAGGAEAGGAEAGGGLGGMPKLPGMPGGGEGHKSTLPAGGPISSLDQDSKAQVDRALSGQAAARPAGTDASGQPEPGTAGQGEDLDDMAPVTGRRQAALHATGANLEERLRALRSEPEPEPSHGSQVQHRVNPALQQMQHAINPHLPPPTPAPSEQHVPTRAQNTPTLAPNPIIPSGQQGSWDLSTNPPTLTPPPSPPGDGGGGTTTPPGGKQPPGGKGGQDKGGQGGKDKGGQDGGMSQAEHEEIERNQAAREAERNRFYKEQLPGHTVWGPLWAGTDTSGLEGLTQAHVQRQLSGGGTRLAVLGHLGPGHDPHLDNADPGLPNTDLSALLAGFDVTAAQVPDAGRDEALVENIFGDDPYDDYARDYAAQARHPATAVLDPATDSNRAPALQELQGFTGYDGASVVDPNDPGLGASDPTTEDNGAGHRPVSDAASGGRAGFPVGAAYHDNEPDGITHTAKEHTMTEHAQCPTCGGLGKVAVRTLAYSGLPQIDQIVNADDSPGVTPAPGQSAPYPPDVAFPIVGWGPDAVQNTVNEAEQQIQARPQGRPGAPGGGGGAGGSVAASRTGGRDNSGWVGDMGGRGIDYPGESAPSGYDGSTNLGQPNPVYNYGGDEPNAPHLPYGHQEALDYTNNPGQNWQPGQPTQDDEGASESGPRLTTSGSSDPFIAAAQEEIVRQQRLIATRNRMLTRQ